MYVSYLLKENYTLQKDRRKPIRIELQKWSISLYLYDVSKIRIYTKHEQNDTHKNSLAGWGEGHWRTERTVYSQYTAHTCPL